MHAYEIAIIIFISLTSTSFMGMWVTSRLKEEWLDGISRDHFKSVRNLIGSLVAIGLGFMLITAKQNYDKRVDEIRLEAAKITLLYRVLDLYGTQADLARQKIIGTVQGQIDLLKEASNKKVDQKQAFKRAKMESFRENILDLPEKNKNQSWIKSTALGLTQEITGLRWKIYNDLDPNLPVALMVFFLFMLLAIFFNMGLVSHFHWLAIIGLLSCSASIAAAFFLIIEFDRPYQGFLAVPLKPLENTLDVMKDGI